MVRIAIIFLVAVAAFVGLRMLLAGKNLSSRQFATVYAALIVGIALIYLGMTGRLHWLFSLVGAVLPFLARSLPLVVRFMGIHNLVSLARRASQGLSGGQRSSGQKSELNTRIFAMVLDHDSGKMDGEVLEGPFQGRKLSDLDLASLLDLFEYSRRDPDSEAVLRSYLDRSWPEWEEQAEAGRGPSFDEGHMTANQAYEILGLKPGVGTDEIRKAHKRLMQKVHPDHGGSDYLAARINEAKAVLMKQHGGH